MFIKLWFIDWSNTPMFHMIHLKLLNQSWINKIKSLSHKDQYLIIIVWNCVFVTYIFTFLIYTL